MNIGPDHPQLAVTLQQLAAVIEQLNYSEVLYQFKFRITNGKDADPSNFERLVVGYIEADLCKKILLLLVFNIFRDLQVFHSFATLIAQNVRNFL